MVAAMAFSCESSLGSAKLRHLVEVGGGGGGGGVVTTPPRRLFLFCPWCDALRLCRAFWLGWLWAGGGGGGGGGVVLFIYTAAFLSNLVSGL